MMDEEGDLDEYGTADKPLNFSYNVDSALE
jgi:hypothetical protein